MTNKNRTLSDDVPQPLPWARQPGETSPSWQAFRLYREMGPGNRSNAKVAKALGKSTQIINRWCRKHRWVSRCEAWDAKCDEVATKAEFDAIVEMRKRHIQISMQMQGLGLSELAKLIKRSKAQAKAIMTADTAARLVDQGMRLERLNRGEPESVTEDRGKMTWADLVKMADKAHDK